MFEWLLSAKLQPIQTEHVDGSDINWHSCSGGSTGLIRLLLTGKEFLHGKFQRRMQTNKQKAPAECLHRFLVPVEKFLQWKISFCLNPVCLCLFTQHPVRGAENYIFHPLSIIFIDFLAALASHSLTACGVKIQLGDISCAGSLSSLIALLQNQIHNNLQFILLQNTITVWGHLFFFNQIRIYIFQISWATSHNTQTPDWKSSAWDNKETEEVFRYAKHPHNRHETITYQLIL